MNSEYLRTSRHALPLEDHCCNFGHRSKLNIIAVDQAKILGGLSLEGQHHVVILDRFSHLVTPTLVQRSCLTDELMTQRADALRRQSVTQDAHGSLHDYQDTAPPNSERIHRNKLGLNSRITNGSVPAVKMTPSAGELYLALQPRVTRIARSLLGEAPTAELVHDVCVNAALSAVRFRGDSAFSSWLYAVVARHVRKWIRTERRRRSFMNEVAHYSSSIASLQPDDLVSGDRLATRLLEALKVLSDRQKTCVIQVQFEGHSVHAVADRLGISPDAVRMNVHRARNHLRSCIETNPKTSE